MVRSGKPEPDGDQSLGELVALAARDLSQLVRYEIDLAKTELRGDMRRFAISGALFGIAAFFGTLILLALLFAYAYLLHWAGAWGGMAGAFGFTALTLAFLGAIAGLLAWRIARRTSPMKRTRESVTVGLGVLRRRGKRSAGANQARGDSQARRGSQARTDSQAHRGQAIGEGGDRAAEVAAAAGTPALADGNRVAAAGTDR